MADKLYEILIRERTEGKTIICNATEATSLKNIKKIVEKGLAEIYDLEGKKIIITDGKKLEYENGEEVKYRKFDEKSEINMLDIEIRPKIQKMKEERSQTQKILEKARCNERMRGRRKEEKIEELREKIREKNPIECEK